MIIQGNSGKACSLKIFFLLISCMYNLFRCKNEDGSSIAKKNALRRLKRSLNSNEMTKRFSGHQQNVSIVSSGLPRCKDFVLVERRGGGQHQQHISCHLFISSLFFVQNHPYMRAAICKLFVDALRKDYRYATRYTSPVILLSYGLRHIHTHLWQVH